MGYNINRRNLLKKTTASSFTLLAASSGSAQAVESAGTVDLVKCGIEHELVSAGDDATKNLVLNSPPSYYHIDDKIVVNNHTTDEERKRLKLKETVVSFDGIRTVPSESLQRKPNHHLGTELRSDFEPGKAVLVDAAYTPPAFGIRTTGSEVTVTTPKSQRSFGSDTEITLELPTQSVNAITYGRTNPRTVERPPEGTETVYDYEKQKTEISVKPRLHVQYRTEQSVLEPREQTEAK